MSIRHTRNAAAAVEQARQALGLTWRYVEEFEAQAERMVNETITDAAFERLMGEVFGTTEADASTRAKNAEAQRVATLRHLWHDAETVRPIRGTAWGAYQVVTEYIDHFAPVKTREDAGDARGRVAVLPPSFDRGGWVDRRDHGPTHPQRSPRTGPHVPQPQTLRRSARGASTPAP